MNDQKAKIIAKQLTSTGAIPADEAMKIIKLLKPRDLVKFSRILRKEMDKQTVHVTSADALDHETDTKLKSIFSGKIIIKTVDTKIGAGIRAQVYDMIYDLSTKSEIKRLAIAAQEEI